MEWKTKTMSSKILSNNSKIALSILTSFSLLMIIACKNNSSVQESSNELQNSQSAKIESQIKIESAITDETIETNFVMLFTREKSPVRIINVASVNEKSDFKKGAKVEIQNISDKAISSVSLGFAPPISCIEYMMVGDLIINDEEITKANKMQIGEKHFTNIPADFAEDHLSLQNFKTCPRKYRKPMVYVWGVQFENGDSWNANDLKQKQN